MSERQYNDDEVAAIFERASKADHTPLPSSSDTQGLTLAALQDIGREVGLSPQAISDAAKSLDRAGQTSSKTFLGLPIGVGRTVEFDRPLSDGDWERLVGDLRETFGARGVIRYDGPFRQWTNGNLQALVEPTPGGYRLRLQTLKGDSRRLMTAGLAMLGVAMVTSIATAVTSGFGNAKSFADIVVMVMIGLGIFSVGALRIPGWARRRMAQIEAVADRLGTAGQVPPQDDPSAGGDPKRLP